MELVQFVAFFSSFFLWRQQNSLGIIASTNIFFKWKPFSNFHCFINFQPSQLEHLCINLCAETMQHFYNTHIFKSSIESCRDEGIHSDVEVDYTDNVPCIDLISSLVSASFFYFLSCNIIIKRDSSSFSSNKQIFVSELKIILLIGKEKVFISLYSSAMKTNIYKVTIIYVTHFQNYGLFVMNAVVFFRVPNRNGFCQIFFINLVCYFFQRTGLLSMLDVECSIRGSAESYIAKVKAQHRHNSRLYEPKPLEPRSFGIQHFAGRVVYDATNFLGT